MDAPDFGTIDVHQMDTVPDFELRAKLAEHGNRIAREHDFLCARFMAETGLPASRIETVQFTDAEGLHFWVRERKEPIV